MPDAHFHKPVSIFVGLGFPREVDSVLEAYQADGTQYALPSSFSTVVLFYNRDLFDAAGVEYPSADWTWADEQAAAEQLTDAGAGVWGDHQPVSFYEFYKVLEQNGASFLSDADKEAILSRNLMKLLRIAA